MGYASLCILGLYASQGCISTYTLRGYDSHLGGPLGLPLDFPSGRYVFRHLFLEEIWHALSGVLLLRALSLHIPLRGMDPILGADPFVFVDTPLGGMAPPVGMHF